VSDTQPRPHSEAWPLVIVGAGAAGMLAAIFAGRGGVRTLLFETRAQPGAKIRVSGGGRCNVLPSRAELGDFHTHGSTNSMRKLLFSWPLQEVRAFFETDLGIPLELEPSGKLFPKSNDPREVVAALLSACEAAGVTLRRDCRVTEIRRRDGGGFELVCADGQCVLAERMCLATGGLSLPKTGSDGAGLAMARRLGHSLVPTHPALVPLLTPETGWGELAGISLPVCLRVLRAEKTLEQREGDFLFTHRGFSGPVVLDVSHHFAGADGAGRRLLAHWGGADKDWDALLRTGGSKRIEAILREHLPRRLARHLIERAGVDPQARAGEFAREQRKRLVGELTRCELAVSGDEGYRTAEVTDGGIALSEVEPAGLESRVVPGLHFCGEILDLSGRIGGYNFLWAWVSGRLVGTAVARWAAGSRDKVDSKELS